MTVMILLYYPTKSNFYFNSSSQDLDNFDLIERDAKNKQLLVLDLILEERYLL